MAIKLRKPTVGPIVGEATQNHLRVFIRGENIYDKGWFSDTDHPETGIFQVAEDSRFTKKLKSRIFKLNSTYDFTGVGIVSGLKAGKTYHYRIGYGKGSLDDFYSSTFNWSEIKADKIKIQSNDKTKSVAFLLGSCRYAMENMGIWLYDDQGDKTLKSAYNEHVSKGKIDLAIWCGDQIYADDLHMASEDWHIREFYDKYRHQFGKQHFNSVTRSIPNYMIMDDHEIEDNWPETKNEGYWHQDSQQYVNAMNAYQAYQASHSPLFKVTGEEIKLNSTYLKDVDVKVKDKFGDVKVERLNGSPQKWWYTFEAGCCEYFVFDCRTERNLGYNHSTPYIIGSLQMEAFKEWVLKKKDEKVKCAVVSVPLFPDYHDGTDQWGDSRWLKQRNEVIKFIDDNKVKRPVFLTGDIHTSFTSFITRQNSNTKIYQIISSPLFWPFPFGKGNPEDYTLNGPMPNNPGWEITTSTKFIKDNNYSRIDIDLDGFRVRVYERRGKMLDDNSFTFNIS